MRSSMLMLMLMLMVGLWLVGGLGWAEDKSKPPAADPAKVLADELKALAAQYTRGDNTAKTMASERDRLALQAQSAIIGLKDAQLQMEQAISAGRFACARVGKVLETDSEVWRCGVPKPEPKEIPKK